MIASFEHFASELAGVDALPGDVIELGVFKGATFVPLAEAALKAGRRCIGVDSFIGFSAAHPAYDRMVDGSLPYDMGQFDAGGARMVHELMERLGHDPRVEIFAGFIPYVLDKIGQGRHFAFAHVDLDQYMPTLETLEWLWPRMVPGGVIACHDWFLEYNCLASLAIKHFTRDEGLPYPPVTPTTYAFLRKEGR